MRFECTRKRRKRKPAPVLCVQRRIRFFTKQSAQRETEQRTWKGIDKEKGSLSLQQQQQQHSWKTFDQQGKTK